MALSKLQRRARIKRRIRKIVSGTAAKPRLSVYRSNKEIYAQLVDDVNGVTLASVSSRNKEINASTKIEAATAVGKLIAEKATKAGVETIAFDRNGYLYHGRVKVLADAAREAGLKF
ncbi:50S ribosomal protein L18 [Polaribacter undariae]|uniref:Large ribosomal subunit protein uL18 n=1 Tax=Polaribacter sejongensis TaxID=985043 RepID=A0AAJ1VGN3_9FLAO|nr:50S ribosomal protein L18 [Polaribacter undariae]MDN3619948.1 50S ribosomal protein L18 [Polaribacter undariae]UWD31709.1 50S ribosomal protein L18 [Polaribacter undariae]